MLILGLILEIIYNSSSDIFCLAADEKDSLSLITAISFSHNGKDDSFITIF